MQDWEQEMNRLVKVTVHIQDMDSVGLITAEIEASLSDPLRARPPEVRAAD